MEAKYDMSTDTFVISFRSMIDVMNSRELSPGVIADYDKHGNIVRLELLDASKTIMSPSNLQLTFHFSVE